jgi:hypothetical protein
MKGTLIKTEQGWIVEFYLKVEGEIVGVDKFPLHPYNVRVIKDCFTSQFSTGVEFEIVDFGSNSYARLINIISFLKKCNVDDKDINNWVKGYNKARETLYTKQQMIEASKYGYEFRDTTSFPEHKFEDSCVNNTKQWLQSLK